MSSLWWTQEIILLLKANTMSPIVNTLHVDLDLPYTFEKEKIQILILEKPKYCKTIQKAIIASNTIKTLINDGNQLGKNRRRRYTKNKALES